ncbi:MAG: hypothetical protein WA213_20695 [Terriglobales bacterium]
MKCSQQHAAEKLAHALTLLRLAKDEEWPELRKQHLDEAERLIEYAVGVLAEAHGEA